MPQSETFFNPYRWVHVDANPNLGRPAYHHQLGGLSGILDCTLTALTPLFVAGKGGLFHQSVRDGRQVPCIPGTSLKGAIRTLAEVISGSAVAHGDGIDDAHAPRRAVTGTGTNYRMDMVSRVFGTLQRDDGGVYAGAVQFSDAVCSDPAASPVRWTEYAIVVGAPKPSHHAFYRDHSARKFYHHHVGATDLITTQLNQNRQIRPAPVGTSFSFQVQYRGLSQDELNMLIYSLFLEQEVEVTLSAAATGTDQAATFSGPMRHKIGGGKSAGAGSCHLQVIQWQQFAGADDRYRNNRAGESRFIDAALSEAIQICIAPYVNRTDRTMQDLRAMLVYSEQDPRCGRFQYPSNQWFKDNSSVRLRPTR